MKNPQFFSLVYKDLMLIFRSRFIFFFMISLVVFYFLLGYVSKSKVRISVIAPDDIKEKVENYLLLYSNKNLILDYRDPHIVIKIEDYNNYWIVDIKVSSPNYLKFVPLVNLFLYKVFFFYKEKIDPLKVSVQNLINQDNLIFSLLFNISMWSFLSFISSEITREKIKKTVLITDNVNLFIWSKVIVVGLVFFIFSLIFSIFFNLFMDKLSFLMLILVYFMILYIYAVLTWLLKNFYFTGILNLFVGFGFMFLPFLRQESIGSVLGSYLFILVFIVFLIFNIWVIKYNKFLQKIVWE